MSLPVTEALVAASNVYTWEPSEPGHRGALRPARPTTSCAST